MAPTPLSAAGTIDGARVLAYMLLLALVLAVVALVVTPWQQSIRGAGRVTAYAPLERQQTVEAPVKGRVVHWYVQEGDHVEAGEPIVDLADNDPELIARLERERRTIVDRVEAATMAMTVADAKIVALDGSRSAAVTSMSLKQQIATDKLDGAQRAYDAAEAEKETAELNLARIEKLHEEGLVSTRKLELAQMKARTTKAKLAKEKAALSAAKRAIKAAKADRSKVGGDAEAKVEDAKSSLQKAKSDKAKAEGDLAKIDVKLAQQQQMMVTAPRAGTVFRLSAKEGGEVVKQGDALAVLVPDVSARAVELWVDGNDAPLITPGREVRIQFEGWPAVQFVGWPSVAIGTFGGEVAFVDATDNGRGQFRIVVTQLEGEEWPDSRYLRQGVRANGWVLLNQVSLGYELWRLFNGFPPAVNAPQDASKASGAEKNTLAEK
ncbi:MAG: HlyD family secretion protein [Nannocystaceae bacterium]|nr:HlyD family secretion protein [bacterium]